MIQKSSSEPEIYIRNPQKRDKVQSKQYIIVIIRKDMLLKNTKTKQSYFKNKII